MKKNPDAESSKLISDGIWKIRSILYSKKRFSENDIKEMSEAGLIADATGGGLVLGPSHEDGGVKFLLTVDEGYSVIGELEGYEYVFNVAASYLCRNLFETWNQHDLHKTPNFESYVIPEATRIIDARLPKGGLFKSKLLLWEHRGHQAIFNKYSTKVHLDTLNKINLDYTFRYLPENIYRARELEIIDYKTGETICKNPIYWKDEPGFDPSIKTW